MAYLPPHLCILLGNPFQVEYDEEGVAARCELSILDELEARLCPGSFRRYSGNILGEFGDVNDEGLKGKGSKGKHLVWLFTLLGVLLLLVFKYYNLLTDSISAGAWISI